jgi:molecular chaperone GrpE
MVDDEKTSNPGELAGDGLGDAAGTPVEEAGDQELGRMQELVADVTNRLMRVQADYENYKRRVQKEKEDLAVYANQKLLLNLLPVLDNLERAMAAPAAPGDEKLRQGVELTARSFRDILAREGLSPIEAVGQSFDPNIHEAVMTVESAEHPDGTVVLEFQKGYRLGDRVIRPSMVQVSKNA